MRDCHTCKVTREIRAGKWKGVPWENTPCAACLSERTSPACGNCPTKKRIDRGELIGLPFEDTPCATCLHHYRHDPVSHHGRTHVGDHALDDVSEEDVHPIFDRPDPDKPHTNRNDPSIAAMSYVFKAILALDRLSRDIVLDRIAYPDKPIVRTASKVRKPVSTVHDRIKKARQAWPALAYAIPMKSWEWTTKDREGRQRPVKTSNRRSKAKAPKK